MVVAPGSAPPFEVEAAVVEDDTYSVLGADPEFREPTEHPIRIWTAVHDMTPAAPGSVSVAEGRPLKLHAVVHDLAEDPTWKEEWISAALDAVLREVAERGLRTLALPVLGRVHGRLPVPRFVALLREALRRRPPASLERLWIVAAPDDVATIRRRLEAGSAGR